MEKAVLDDASLVVAVSPLVQQEFQEMTQTPVELVTNGFDECEFSDAECVEAHGGPEKDFIIVHTGLFAADGNPELLWKALKDKCTNDEKFRKALKIRLIGKTDDIITDSIKREGLDSNLEDLGYQPHSTTIASDSASEKRTRI